VPRRASTGGARRAINAASYRSGPNLWYRGRRSLCRHRRSPATPAGVRI